MTQQEKIKVGVGILSWRAHETIRQTLLSYEQEKLFSLFDQSILYFNDLCEEDKRMANEFKVPFAGGENLGIFEGMRAIAKQLDSMDYILFLQNDCPMVENHEELKRQLAEAIALLEEGTIDMIRMRHRWKVGEGFDLAKYLRYFGVSELNESFSFEETGIQRETLPDSLAKKLRRTFRPSKAKKLLGMSVYLEKNPHLIHPRFIQGEGDTFIVDSAVIPFTEQPFLIGKKILSQLFDYVEKHPRSRTLNGFQTMEIPLNDSFWKNGGFKIGVSKGVFTHNRFDGSFRKNHPAYEEKSD